MEVIVAAISALSAVVVAHISHSRKLDKVRDAVATSNGKTTGQYVEELSYHFAALASGQEFIQKQLAEHTVQDAANFAALDARIRLISKEMAE